MALAYNTSASRLMPQRGMARVGAPPPAAASGRGAAGVWRGTGRQAAMAPARGRIGSCHSPASYRGRNLAAPPPSWCAASRRPGKRLEGAAAVSAIAAHALPAPALAAPVAAEPVLAAVPTPSRSTSAPALPGVLDVQILLADQRNEAWQLQRAQPPTPQQTPQLRQRSEVCCQASLLDAKFDTIQQLLAEWEQSHQTLDELHQQLRRLGHERSNGECSYELETELKNAVEAVSRDILQQFDSLESKVHRYESLRAAFKGAGNPAPTLPKPPQVALLCQLQKEAPPAAQVSNVDLEASAVEESPPRSHLASTPARSGPPIVPRLNFPAISAADDTEINAVNLGPATPSAQSSDPGSEDESASSPCMGRCQEDQLQLNRMNRSASCANLTSDRKAGLEASPGFRDRILHQSLIDGDEEVQTSWRGPQRPNASFTPSPSVEVSATVAVHSPIPDLRAMQGAAPPPLQKATGALYASSAVLPTASQVQVASPALTQQSLQPQRLQQSPQQHVTGVRPARVMSSAPLARAVSTGALHVPAVQHSQVQLHGVAAPGFACGQ
eukprot:TRINITY_DN92823_c0_g1_i1.p1 TRINITY_DN92823_c0_g1~~TRINITY_DN92823_c0_g1_i1.p1  ORF type:complete len:585 (+),score=87.11 TRINITY_DN92823_c0_g1_i1:89-1756(+)